MTVALSPTAAKTAAMIGAGLIGRSWALAFARGGFAVRLFDPAAGAAAKSLELLPQMLRELAELDLLGVLFLCS